MTRRAHANLPPPARRVVTIGGGDRGRRGRARAPPPARDHNKNTTDSRRRRAPAVALFVRVFLLLRRLAVGVVAVARDVAFVSFVRGPPYYVVLRFARGSCVFERVRVSESVCVCVCDNVKRHENHKHCTIDWPLRRDESRRVGVRLRFLKPFFDQASSVTRVRSVVVARDSKRRDHPEVAHLYTHARERARPRRGRQRLCSVDVDAESRSKMSSTPKSVTEESLGGNYNNNIYTRTLNSNNDDIMTIFCTI